MAETLGALSARRHPLRVPAAPKATGTEGENAARGRARRVFTLGVEGAAVNTSENVPVRNLRTRGNARAPLGRCNVTFASPARRRGIRELDVNGRGRRVRGDVGIRPTPRLVLLPVY